MRHWVARKQWGVRIMVVDSRLHNGTFYSCRNDDGDIKFQVQDYARDKIYKLGGSEWV